MTQIKPEDFSVIIQGPILGKPGEEADRQLTKRCITSIRSCLPGAQIILSTWKGEDATHLDYDTIVYNDDPGAITYNDYELKQVYNNNNRQIASTLNGLSQANRKYSVKMRGDFYLDNANFINYLNKYSEYGKYKFFSTRIITPTYFFRDPEKAPLLFHISDLFQAGTTKDMLDLWDIPLQPEPETTRAFAYSKQFANDPFRFNQYKMRYASEQYIWQAFCKKHGLDLSLNYFCEVPYSIIGKAVQSVIDNFIILSPEQIGIRFPQRLLHSEKQLYTFKRWQQLYTALSVQKSAISLLKVVLKVKFASAKFVLKNLKRR
jgi:hypothetical protein